MRYGIIFVMMVLFSVPAFAGTINVANGRGMWQSTLCQRPIAPTYIGVGGENSAASMNQTTSSFNRFVQETQNYVDCMSQEAKRDSEQSNAVILSSLEANVNAAQMDVNRARQQLFGK
jgi:hypothetical protein